METTCAVYGFLRLVILIQSELKFLVCLSEVEYGLKLKLQ